ncbi:MAG TPA: GNAT family N-acetyltransferase [Candidatus Dormibacteraeota bacterium]|nr:GNAT family N-acetyltransferase [Candidatus Dormibacteraeota bacterium]
MDVLRATTVADYMQIAGGYLAAREAEQNLIFGICSNLEADPSQYATGPYLAVVVHGDRVVGTAIRTPPWRLVLGVMEHPGAVHQLVQDLKADPAGKDLPGALGPSEAVGHFAEAWAAAMSVRANLSRHERSFRLRTVIPPRSAPGSMRRAGPADRALLAAWARAFHEEALPGGPDQDHDATADRWIRNIGRTAYLWEDGGRPVSLAGVGGLTPNGIRVGPVYTPPELRGRGYASNLVATASQLQLDTGRSFVFLFTDLANPTANRIYQAIGYEPVNDVDEYAFEPA